MDKELTARQYLEAELARKAAVLEEIVAKADAEGRSPNDDERPIIERNMAEVAELKSRIQGMKDNDELRENIRKMAQAGGVETVEVEAPQGVKSLGEAYIKSDGYKALKAEGFVGRRTVGPIEVPNFAKNTVTEGEFTVATPVITQPGLVDLAFQPLTVAALMPNVPVAGPSVRYLQATLIDLASGETAEGDPKTEADFEYDEITATLAKLTGFIKVSSEMLEDAPAVAAHINAQLPAAVRRNEEAKLVSELYAQAGNAGDPADGSEVESGTPNRFDAILEAIMVVRTSSFKEPDGLLIHPMDWAAMAATKSGVDGNYFSGGPYQGPARNPWGLRAVITTAATPGLALVGAFSEGAEVLRRGGLTVESTNSNEDDFRNNLVAIRAEERVALAVLYPDAFATADVSGGA